MEIDPEGTDVFHRGKHASSRRPSLDAESVHSKSSHPSRGTRVVGYTGSFFVHKPQASSRREGNLDAREYLAVDLVRTC